MIDPFLLAKWVHLLSAAVLFGTGLGIAWFMWSAHLTGDAGIIAATARQVVRADWIFTLTSGIVQPASGAALVALAGYDPLESWLVASYGLYALAFLCWAPVVRLQIRARDLAAVAAARRVPLDARYRACMRLWFALGWPAFLALLAIFALMIARPQLW